MKIFIVDSHQIVIDGLVSLLHNNKKFEVVGTAVTEEEAKEWLQNNKADLLLINLNLRNTDIPDFIKNTKRAKTFRKIIVTSDLADVKIIKDLFKIGINGYIEKAEGFEKFSEALEQVKKGGLYISDALKEKIVNSFACIETRGDKNNEQLFASLTARELEVMNLICDGNSSKEISEKLFISVNTVETHRQHILQKLNVKSSFGLIKFAMENNLVN